MNTRCRAIKGYVKIAMTLGALGMTLSGVAVAQTSRPSICNAFTVLKNQQYALCAGASSFIFDKLAYAKCIAMTQLPYGNSISAPLKYPCSDSKGCDIETVNKEGIANGSFIASTYSPPAPAANVALYNCNTSGSNAQGSSDAQGNPSGSYAQCDGGICFTSTPGTDFPGIGAIGPSEIVCSCPITTTSDSYQVFGPSSCPKTASDYDAVCGAGITANDNGYTPLYIGAPTGIPAQLSVCLTGSNPLKTCKRPAR